MTFQLILETRATAQASAFLGEDPEGLTQVLSAIDALATQPRPAGSFPFGSPDRRRLQVGRYRVLYEIKDDAINVVHIAQETPRP